MSDSRGTEQAMKLEKIDMTTTKDGAKSMIQAKIEHLQHVLKR